jgi:transcriptional regulator with XRE-family HTH domain
VDLGEKIRTLRKKASLTQVQLAEKALISRSYLADVEKNRYNPSLDTLDKIIEALGITKSEFFSDDPINEEKKSPENLFPEDVKITKKVIREHSEFLEHAQTFFMNDQLADEDKDDLFRDLSELYFDSKQRNRQKYNKKK